MNTRKITVEVDRELLRRAQDRTGKGVSATVRQGLALVAMSGVFEQLQALRGRVKFTSLRILGDDRY